MRRAHPLIATVTGEVEGVRQFLPRLLADRAMLDRYCALAAGNGQLEVLKLLHGTGANLGAEDQLALRLAVANGRSTIVDYLVEHGQSPAAIAPELVKAAARKGHVHMLERLRDLGCDLAPCAELTDELITRPALAPACAFLEDAIPGLGPLARLVAAIRGGSLATVQAAFSGIDHRRHEGVLLETAASTGAVEILRYLYESGVALGPEKSRVLQAAAEGGHNALLRLLINTYGCDPGLVPAACAMAAENGHLESLTLIWTSGGAKSPPSATTLALTALNGHEDTFDYLTGAGGLDAIADHREAIRRMTDRILAAEPVYRPSELWKFFNEVNLEQLRRFGMSRFKRSVNQNYFNYVPLGLGDPQLTGLLRAFLTRFPIRTVLSVRMADPDCYSGSGKLAPMDVRVFHLWQNSSRFSPVGRWLQMFLYRMLVGLLWRFVELHDELSLCSDLQEPALGGPITTAVGNRRVSQDLAHSVLECNVILDGVKQPADAPPLRIAEVGAGYGRVGDVLLSSRNCRYFVFDIPPSLLVSQWYLSSRYAHRRIFRFRNFERFEDVRSELDSAEIAFFTPDQIAHFPDGYFDIAINISSLHEMRPEQQQHILAQMYRVAAERVYIKQYRHYLNPWDKIVVTENDYAVPEGWRKRVWRTDRVDRRFFEAVLERTIQPVRKRVAVPAGPKRPTITILLANYNDATYLYTSLEGILSQTDPADEVIVVDDGSTDDSARVIEKMLARHPNARLIRQGRNRGQHAAIQRALLEATSDYVAWASSDDLLLPNFVARSRAVLMEHHGCGLCFSRLCAWRDGSTEVEEYSEANHGAAFDLGDKPKYFSPAELRRVLSSHYVWISGNTVVARRDLLLEMGGFRRELRWHADWFTFYAIALRNGAVGIPETLAMMRERPETYSRQGMGDGKSQDAVLGALLDTFDNPGFSDLGAIVRRCPSLLSPFGGRNVLRAASYRPRYWKMAFRLLLWHASRVGWRRVKSRIRASLAHRIRRVVRKR